VHTGVVVAGEASPLGVVESHVTIMTARTQSALAPVIPAVRSIVGPSFFWSAS
jgi:hypothetical protein